MLTFGEDVEIVYSFAGGVRLRLWRFGASGSFSVEVVWSVRSFRANSIFFRSVSVGEKAIVTDTHESGWKNVEKETPNKFHGV